MVKRILPPLAALVLLGAGCTASPTTPTASLAYTLPSDGSISVTTKSVDASTLVSADDLLAQATECGEERAAQYYLDIENTFTGMTGTEYTFTIAGDYEMPTWTVTVLPNAPAYNTQESFKKDFDICAAGGDLYPKNMNANALMFAASCGSGYSGGKENGCSAIRTAIESTLSLK